MDWLQLNIILKLCLSRKRILLDSHIEIEFGYIFQVPNIQIFKALLVFFNTFGSSN